MPGLSIFTPSSQESNPLSSILHTGHGTHYDNSFVVVVTVSIKQCDIKPLSRLRIISPRALVGPKIKSSTRDFISALFFTVSEKQR